MKKRLEVPKQPDVWKVDETLRFQRDLCTKKILYLILILVLCESYFHFASTFLFVSFRFYFALKPGNPIDTWMKRVKKEFRETQWPGDRDQVTVFRDDIGMWKIIKPVKAVINTSPEYLDLQYLECTFTYMPIYTHEHSCLFTIHASLHPFLIHPYLCTHMPIYLH